MLNGLRILIALLIAELFWIVTAWPDGPTLITFTAVSVILFSARADTAFSGAIEFAVGCAGASAVAVILNQAILPVVPSDFLALAVVLFLVLVPLGVLAAGTWHKTAFVGMVTNVMPILAIQNEPSYEGNASAQHRPCGRGRDRLGGDRDRIAPAAAAGPAHPAPPDTHATRFAGAAGGSSAIYAADVAPSCV